MGRRSERDEGRTRRGGVPVRGHTPAYQGLPAGPNPLAAPARASLPRLDRRRQRVEEREERRPILAAELSVAGGRDVRLAAVQADRVVDRGGAAVVEVGGRVAEPPERRGPPFGRAGRVA